MTSLPNSSLIIIEINVNSIISHQRRLHLQEFIKENKPDVMLLNETKLNNKHSIHIKGFEFHRINKSAPNMTGTGIIIKANIKHEAVDISDWNLQVLECTAILVHTTQKSLCIISCYRHASKLNPIANDVEIIEDKCTQNNWSLIMGGDFNAKHTEWNNKNICAQGRSLHQWMTNNGIARNICIESTIESTYRRGTYTSVLDFFIIHATLDIRRCNNYPNHLEALDFDSDHRAVKLEIELSSRIQKQDRNEVMNYANTDWSHFKNHISASIENIHIPTTRNLNPDEIDAKLAELTTAIKSSINTVIPKMTIQKDNMLQLPPDVIDLIRQKKNMRRRWERIRLCQAGNQLKTEIKILSKIIDERIRQVTTEKWSLTLSSIKMGPTAFRTIKKMCNMNPPDAPKQIIDPNTGFPTANQDQIANLIGINFERVHHQNILMGSSHFTNEVNQLVKEKFHNYIPKIIFSFDTPATVDHFSENCITTTNNLKSIINRRANKKSNGPDGISNYIIRKLPIVCINKIAKLFNHIYNSTYFPTEWKSADIVPIYKRKGATNLVTSYRPISLLSCLGKLYEKTLKDIIDQHCEENNTLPDDQYGFRSNRSTTHALVTLKTDIAEQFNKKCATIACSTDIQKAFDTVWIEGAVYKMNTVLGFDDHICKILYHFLRNRKFNVKIGKSKSRSFNIAAGVPQGGVLSALLYAIYIADMPLPPQHHNPIKRLQFADDMIVYLSAKDLFNAQDRINTYMETLIIFLQKWKIRINADKCEAIVFKGPNRLFGKMINRYHRDVAIDINGTVLIPQTSIKYLGVVFNKNISHTRHVDHILSKVNKAYMSLRPTLARLNGLNPKLKVLCYKQLIRPIITYGFPAWSNISSHQMERIRKVERTILRSCTNTRRRADKKYVNNSILYEKADIKRIDATMVNQAITFFTKPYADCQDFQRCRTYDETQPIDPRMVYKPPWNLNHLNNNELLFINNKLLLYHARSFINNNQSLVYNTNQ